MRWVDRLRQRWVSLPPLFRGLSLFALFTIVVLNVGLRILPWNGPHRTGARLVAWDTYRLSIPFDRSIRETADSWHAMSLARERLREHPGGPVYAPLLERGTKFQYPPQSLLVCDVARPTAAGFKGLNLVSWLMMWVNAVLVGLILLASCDLHVDRSVFARRPRGRWILAALAAGLTLTFYPVARAMALGQVQTWLNAGAAAVIWLAMRSRWGGAGAITGLMAVVKPQYVLVAVWYAVRERWRAAGWAALVGGVLTAVSIAAFGPRVHLECILALASIASRGEAVFANQSFNGLANRMMGNGDALHFTPGSFAPYSPVVHAVTIVTSIGLAVVGLGWGRERRKRPGIEDLCIVVLAATMASPIAWEHHYGVLPPIYAWALPALLRRPVLGRWTMPALGASFVLCAHFARATRRLADTPLSPLMSHVLWGALILLGLLLLLRARAGSDERETDAGRQPAATLAP